MSKRFCKCPNEHCFDRAIQCGSCDLEDLDPEDYPRKAWRRLTNEENGMVQDVNDKQWFKVKKVKGGGKRLVPQFKGHVDWKSAKGFAAMCLLLSCLGAEGEYVLWDSENNKEMDEEGWKRRNYTCTSMVDILHTSCGKVITAKIQQIQQGYRAACTCHSRLENQYRQIDRLSDNYTYDMQKEVRRSYWHCVGARAQESTFDLELEDVFRMLQQQGGKCALSGLAFDVTRDYLCPSIDARDPNKGHTLHNCHIVIRIVNYAKNALTVDEFKRVLGGDRMIVYDRPRMAERKTNESWRLVDPARPMNMTPRQTFVWHALQTLASPVSRQEIETYINDILCPSIPFDKQKSLYSLNQFVAQGYVKKKIRAPSASTAETRRECPPLPTVISDRVKGTIYRVSEGVYQKWNGYRTQPMCSVCVVKGASHPDSTGRSQALCAAHARMAGTHTTHDRVWHYRPVLPIHHPIITCSSCTAEIPIKDILTRKNRAGAFKPLHDDPYATNQSRNICRECRTKHTMASRNRDRVTYVWSKLAGRMHGRKDGDLVKDDLEGLCTIDICPISGIPLVYESGWCANQASPDRIDNSIGYSKRNVQIVSLLVNYARQQMSVTNDELRFVLDACRLHLSV